jgi:O-antigen ligase
MLLALTGISRFFSSPKLQKNFSQIILFILVGAITTLFSQARTSIISLYIGFLFLIVINQKSRIPVIFLFISVSVFILWGLNDGFLMDFFRRGQVDENFYSLSGRLFHWSNSLDLLRSSPIIGTSYYSGIRFTLTSEYYGSFTNLDNTFIETLYSLGIIGFILISSYFVRIWISLFTKLGIGRVTGFHHLSIEFLLIFFMINLHAFFGPTIETAGITTLLCFPLLIYASANSKYLNNR